MITANSKIIFSIDFEENRSSREDMIVFIEDQVMKTEIFDKIDELLHNENDKLIEFYYYSDDSYVFKKKKKVVNLKNLSEYNWVEYEWFELPEYDVKNFYSILLNAYEIALQKQIEQSKINYTEERYGQDLSGKTIFYKRRDSLLKQSDWMFSVDIVDTIEPEKLELWKLYRQKMRDVPQDNADEPSAWKWLMPLTPDEWVEFNARVTEEYKQKNNYSVDSPYLSVPQHFITYKQDLRGRFTGRNGYHDSTFTNISEEEKLDNLLEKLINETN